MAGQTNWDQNLNKFDKVLAVDSFTANTASGSVVFSATSNPTITGELDLENIYVSGNLTVNGTATLNNIISVTASYSSGSTIFGDSLIDTHRFTGSVFITGSSFNWNNSRVIASNITSSMSVASASQALTASYYGGTVTSASYALTASFLQGTVTSASYAFTASFLQGTASQALTASKISIVNLALDAGTYFPMFANNASGPVSLFADASTYTYQPSTNILTVTSSFALTASYVTPYEGAWISYTPNWTAASSNPVIGNGTIEGWYKVVGKTCFVRGNIAMGSTTTFGSGEWYVSMPFTASHADAILMTANLLDNTTAWYNAVVNGARAGFNYKAPLQYQAVGGTANDVNATQPFTWTNSDRFLWNGSFEIA
jgi:hypothetical protein